MKVFALIRWCPDCKITVFEMEKALPYFTGDISDWSLIFDDSDCSLVGVSFCRCLEDSLAGL